MSCCNHFPYKILTEISARFLVSFWPRSAKTHLGKILALISVILSRSNQSLRSRKDLSRLSQDVKIIKSHRDLINLAEISPVLALSRRCYFICVIILTNVNTVNSAQ